MKRILVIIVAILALSSVAFAQATALPDYQKDDKLIDTYLCDGGKTTVKGYAHNEWMIDEIRTASGDVFVRSSMGLFMQLAGSKEMKRVTHKEWDEALKAKAMAFYNALHNSGPTDCKRQ